MEDRVRASLNAAEVKANKTGSHMVIVGILPTLFTEHVSMEALSANPRYTLLNDQIFAARGEDVQIAIDGVERLAVTADTIVPEGACTSTQYHIQVSPESFSQYWNAAQAIAGVQLAIGANSPFLFGKELMRETRIPLFEQTADTRTHELKAQGVRPRVWFGERWVTSIFDLFEENSRYYPALLPVVSDEDAIAVLDRGDTPQLSELRLHNGTIYRWNRPVYDVVRDKPHLRVENRVLPAGPTVRRHGRQRRLLLRPGPGAGRGRAADLVADVVQRGRGELPRGGPAGDRRRGLLARRRYGRRRPSWCCAGCCRWRRVAWTPGASDTDVRDRLLGIIEQRCLTHRNGASWQAESSTGSTQRARWAAGTRCGGCSAGTGSTCTPTCPCTSGR